MSPRGCLVSIVVFVTLVLGVLWFALPPVVGGLAAGVLDAVGVHGTGTRVDVGADPPLRLILLDADRVRVRSDDVEIQNVHADSLDITLRDVSISGRRFAFIEGTMSGVRVTADSGTTLEAETVRITGPAEAAGVAITLNRASVQSLISTAVTASTGNAVNRITLASPDRVAVATPRGTVDGRLRVSPAGELFLALASGEQIPLVATGADPPGRLRSVQVAGDGLELAGLIDLTQ